MRTGTKHNILLKRKKEIQKTSKNEKPVYSRMVLAYLAS